VGLGEGFALNFDGLRAALSAGRRRVREAGGLASHDGLVAAAGVGRLAQENLERAMLHLAKELRERTGSTRLCVSGGVGLNVTTNRRLRDEAGFDEIFVLPACHDGGNAIGAAAWGSAQILPNRSVPQSVANYYLGRSYPEHATETKTETRTGAGTGQRYETDIHTSTDGMIRRAARLLATGQAIGWYQGGSEAGPRALGNRSILADPRMTEMRDHLNICVKLREVFRPFAPVIPVEYAPSWFDLPVSPHMLMAARVLPGREATIPAVVHVDGTARIQTVSSMENALLHDLLIEFGRLTGVPILLNTSFNGPGEPLVETPSDALACFDRLDLEHLFIGRREWCRQTPEDIWLEAVPGWEAVVGDVLAAERNRPFLAHVAARAGLTPHDLATMIPSILECLPSGLAAMSASAGLDTERRAYLLRRLFFLLRREALVVESPVRRTPLSRAVEVTAEASAP
jgi:carbamoyltransferase